MDPVYSSTVSFFFIDGNIDGVFLEIGPSYDWGVLTSDENEKLCSEYGNCTIPFYECIFSILGFFLPFIAFEVKVLKHLVIRGVRGSVWIGFELKTHLIQI